MKKRKEKRKSYPTLLESTRECPRNEEGEYQGESATRARLASLARASPPSTGRSTPPVCVPENFRWDG